MSLESNESSSPEEKAPPAVHHSFLPREPKPTPPPPIDYDKLAADSLAKNNAELKAVAAKMAKMWGTVVNVPAPTPSPVASVETGPLIELDWRGESVYYIEPGRKVWLFISYWGGPNGNLQHIDAVWQYDDQRREQLTAAERIAVLRFICKAVKEKERITVISEELTAADASK